MNEAAFSDWLGVNREPARLLAVLFAADGQMVSHADLCRQLGASLTGIRSSMARLRAAMEAGSYYASYGEGYRLTGKGMAECRAAIADAQTRQVAA